MKSKPYYNLTRIAIRIINPKPNQIIKPNRTEMIFQRNRKLIKSNRKPKWFVKEKWFVKRGKMKSPNLFQLFNFYIALRTNNTIYIQENKNKIKIINQYHCISEGLWFYSISNYWHLVVKRRKNTFCNQILILYNIVLSV